jgi:flagellar assembly protein FliH
MAGVRHSLLKHWEENAMQIAAAIAYQTIMRDPAIRREVPLDLLREALELAMNCAALKIRMNPRDVEALQEPIRAILEETGNLATAEVVADPKISVGGCVVESSLGVIDERLESRLERIVAELSE